MSWNVGPITGRPAKVRERLAAQFANAKQNVQHIPAEVATVEQVEKLVNAQLDFMAEFPAVAVEAGGSASTGYTDNPASCNVSVKVTPLHGFVG